MQGHARDRHQESLLGIGIRCSAFLGCFGQCDLLLNEGSLCPPTPLVLRKNLPSMNVTAARKPVEDLKLNQLIGPLDAILRDNGTVP